MIGLSAPHVEKFSEREFTAGYFVIIGPEAEDGSRDIEGGGFGEALPLTKVLMEQWNQLITSMVAKASEDD